MKIRIDKILISICLALLAGYLLILFKVICLKYLSISDILPHLERMKYHKPYNLVPFDTIRFYLLNDSMPLLRRAGNIFGNIALFVPIGMLLPVVFRFARNIFPVLLISFLLSSSLELFQYKLATGSADIDDVILNTLGGLSGYVVFLILKARFKSETKTMIASLILFFILLFTGGWFASIEFSLDLGFMSGGRQEVEINITRPTNDSLMTIPVRYADVEGKLEEIRGDTLIINKFQIIRDKNQSNKGGTAIMIMSDANNSSNPISNYVVSENTYILRKDVDQYSTTQFEVKYSISRLDSIPIHCNLQIWIAHPDSNHVDTLCYRIVHKR